MIVEIQQLFYLITPKGRGVAKFLINRGDDADLQWVVFQDNGEVWTWQNRDIKL